MTINEAMKKYRLPNPAYEFLTDYHTCEGMIGLRAASEIEFKDDGHAIAWAMQQ